MRGVTVGGHSPPNTPREMDLSTGSWSGPFGGATPLVVLGQGTTDRDKGGRGHGTGDDGPGRSPADVQASATCWSDGREHG
jgi:hypothetical protein